MRRLLGLLAVTVFASLGGAQAGTLARLELARGKGAGVLVGAQVTLAEGAASGTYETVAIPAPAFDTAVVSWNALTPGGSALRLEVRARVNRRWSRYYPYANWAEHLRELSA